MEDSYIAAAKPADFSDYFEKCARRLSETGYHRGISTELLLEFQVGYDPAWVSPKAAEEGKVVLPSKRLIIPTGPDSYVARAIDPDAKVRYYKEGKSHLFNEDCLDKADKPIFIVEGEIDALSIMELGYEAVALGGKDNYHLLLQALETRKPKVPLILAFDHEADSVKARKVTESVGKLARKLDDMGIYNHIENELYGDCKDANEAFLTDKSGLCLALSDAEAHAKEAPFRPISASLPELITKIHTAKDMKDISTGFPSLDDLLGGGLQPQLYILGALSSLGKTTFVLQIADTLSANGMDVLYFALEMAPEDLAMKSLSRLSWTLDDTTAKIYAKTALGVKSGKWIGQPDEAVVQKAMEAYKEQSAHLYFPMHGRVTVAEIKKCVQRMVLAGRSPVVIVDYLQLLAPPSDVRLPSDKAIVDANLTALKEIIIDYEVPILCISSLNRASYADPVTMGSFKETGNIEYTADLLIGMNYAGIRDIKDPAELREHIRGEKEKAMRGEWIDIEVELLKARLAATSTCILSFCPRFNIFEDRFAGLHGSPTPHFEPPEEPATIPAYPDEEHKHVLAALEEMADHELNVKSLSKRLSLSAARTKRLITECGYVLDAAGHVRKSTSEAIDLSDFKWNPDAPF